MLAVASAASSAQLALFVNPAPLDIPSTTEDAFSSALLELTMQELSADSAQITAVPVLQPSAAAPAFPTSSSTLEAADLLARLGPSQSAMSALPVPSLAQLVLSQLSTASLALLELFSATASA